MRIPRKADKAALINCADAGADAAINRGNNNELIQSFVIGHYIYIPDMYNVQQ